MSAQQFESGVALLMDVTRCSRSAAENLLRQARGDTNRALDLFYQQQPQQQHHHHQQQQQQQQPTARPRARARVVEKARPAIATVQPHRYPPPPQARNLQTARVANVSAAPQLEQHVGRVIEVTRCTRAAALQLLQQAKGDSNRAINLFFQQSASPAPASRSLTGPQRAPVRAVATSHPSSHNVLSKPRVTARVAVAGRVTARTATRAYASASAPTYEAGNFAGHHAQPAPASSSNGKKSLQDADIGPNVSACYQPAASSAAHNAPVASVSAKQAVANAYSTVVPAPAPAPSGVTGYAAGASIPASAAGKPRFVTLSAPTPAPSTVTGYTAGAPIPASAAGKPRFVTLSAPTPAPSTVTGYTAGAPIPASATGKPRFVTLSAPTPAPGGVPGYTAGAPIPASAAGKPMFVTLSAPTPAPSSTAQSAARASANRRATNSSTSQPKPKKKAPKRCDKWPARDKAWICSNCGFGSGKDNCGVCGRWPANYGEGLLCSDHVFGSKKDNCARCGRWEPNESNRHPFKLCSDCGFGSKKDNCCAKTSR
eukprot:INCI14989.1.p1 GENE.INCI14989.1~~INCI14989.1.p1  ORF type:complete len:542 (+),score=64.84 INCI14989.1:367-1992(+)